MRWILRLLSWVAARVEDVREYVLNVLWVLETLIKNRPRNK